MRRHPFVRWIALYVVQRGPWFVGGMIFELICVWIGRHF